MRTQFSNLTKLQVEGLQESLDFLHNGYIVRASGSLGRVHWFHLLHQSNGSRIRVYLYTSELLIKRDGKIVKRIVRPHDGREFAAQVNSQNEMTCWQTKPCVGENMIFGFDSPNSDEE